ncbi:ABC transporter permease [Metaclostridioides mangenotii]|uniref:ABC transporter permease n=1 Tax=Metaclostridioides mangenotii TaxID=1540 RepID=UPI0028E39785|nr:ABC transporter permease [Clostridioides mangenotii]
MNHFFKENKGLPVFSILIIVAILLGCIFIPFIKGGNHGYMDLNSVNLHPNNIFYFGTDSLGRDIFNLIWYGGRASLFIGFTSTIISTVVGVIYGSISGLASKSIDTILMRFCEITLSIPTILLVIFVQGILGNNNIFTICVAIGISSWMSIAKIVRVEINQMKNSEYVVISRIMGGSFLHVLKTHLIPNFIPSIMFIIVSNIGSAIVMESTLSFLGLGLPVEIASWGSMLSMSEGALLSNSWWIVFIPGFFIVLTLVSITNIGNFIRENLNKKLGNL